VCVISAQLETLTLKHVIPSAGLNVCGVTSLNDQLYVARYGQSDIDVYDTETFELQRRIAVRRIAVDGLGTGITALASCAVNNCLYVAGWRKMITERGKTVNRSALHRVELSGQNRQLNWRCAGRAQALSTNSLSNVLITCWNIPNKILEFTTHGSLVRDICLQSEVNYPRHAVQLASGQFVISHGGNGSQCRVCLVDGEGRVQAYYGNKPGRAIGQLNNPGHLAEDGNGSIIVADCRNDRILVLRRCLSEPSYLPFPGNGSPSGPYALCLDKSRDRLYVGEICGKRMLVFDGVGRFTRSLTLE
jgi:hypothetical protein